MLCFFKEHFVDNSMKKSSLKYRKKKRYIQHIFFHPFTHISYLKRIRQFCKLISALFTNLTWGITYIQIYKDNSFDHIKC